MNYKVFWLVNIIPVVVQFCYWCNKYYCKCHKSNGSGSLQ